MHLAMIPVLAFYRMLADSAPKLDGFDDVGYLFANLWQALAPVILIIVVVAAIMALVGVFAPKLANKVLGWFRLG